MSSHRQTCGLNSSRTVMAPCQCPPRCRSLSQSSSSFSLLTSLIWTTVSSLWPVSRLFAFERRRVDGFLGAAVAVAADLRRLRGLGEDAVEHADIIALIRELIEVALVDVDELARMEHDVLALVDTVDVELALDAVENMLRARMAVHVVVAARLVDVDAHVGITLTAERDAAARLGIAGDVLWNAERLPALGLEHLLHGRPLAAAGRPLVDDFVGSGFGHTL